MLILKTAVLISVRIKTQYIGSVVLMPTQKHLRHAERTSIANKIGNV